MILDKVGGPSSWLKMLKIKKTPEMNELEPDKNSLKIWAHNFEKQKS